MATKLAFQNDAFWRAIDRAAALRGITTYEMARSARCDGSLLRPSRRGGVEKEVWMSVRSLAQILGAIGMSLTEFDELMSMSERAFQRRNKAAAAERRAVEEGPEWAAAQ